MIAHDLSNGTRSYDVQTTSNKTTDFDSFLLTPLVLNGLTECGFVRPSPIQVEAIPLAKCGIGRLHYYVFYLLLIKCDISTIETC